MGLLFAGADDAAPGALVCCATPAAVVFTAADRHNPQSKIPRIQLNARTCRPSQMTATDPASTPTAASLASLMLEVMQQTYPASTLYVVATPIGNIGDITVRALHVLALVDAVACEDTRNTAQLLARYGLNKPLIAAHQHNEREAADKLVARLQAGERIALVSDAGTPAVSDPGARIVDAVRRAGLRVTPLPGPSAAVSAVSASGLVQDQFHFVGFLPNKAKQRESALLALKSSVATLVFYEAPHRIEETIASLTRVFEGTRNVVFAREISKLFEEIHRCPLSDAQAWLAADAHRHKGEYVIVLEGAPQNDDEGLAGAEADRVLKILLGSCSVKQAATLAAELTGQKKNALYERALQLSAAPPAA